MRFMMSAGGALLMKSKFNEKAAIEMACFNEAREYANVLPFSPFRIHPGCGLYFECYLTDIAFTLKIT